MSNVHQCAQCGELMLHSTWVEVGSWVYSSGACPYCLYTPAERQLALRVKEVTEKRVWSEVERKGTDVG